MYTQINSSSHLRSARIGWNTYAKRSHDNAVSKGFWPEGGRNFGEMICLVHSELSEAYEAALTNLPDDKLTMYPGFNVEVADAIIRLLDTGHSRGIDFDTELMAAGQYVVGVYTSLEADLMKVHCILSRALEHHRKKRDDAANEAIVAAVGCLLSICGKYDIDIVSVVEAKMGYNSSRPYMHGKQY